MKTPLFSLLLLLTPVDDVVAQSTPELDDDAVAAVNNDYQDQRRLDPGEAPRDRPIPQAFSLDTSVSLPCPLPSPRPPRARRGSARTGPLFVFMSLQC
jgi:hypothetical protein